MRELNQLSIFNNNINLTTMETKIDYVKSDVECLINELQKHRKQISSNNYKELRNYYKKNSYHKKKLIEEIINLREWFKLSYSIAPKTINPLVINYCKRILITVY